MARIPRTIRRVVADVTVSVDASLAEVFDYLVDPRHRAEWQASLRDIAGMTPMGGHPGDIGTSWTDITVVPGVHPRMEVVASERPRRWVEIGQWAFVEAALVLSVSRAEDGLTSMRARAIFTLPIVFIGVIPVLRMVVPPAVRADLRGAAEVIVARRAP